MKEHRQPTKDQAQNGTGPNIGKLSHRDTMTDHGPCNNQRIEKARPRTAGSGLRASCRPEASCFSCLSCEKMSEEITPAAVLAAFTRSPPQTLSDPDLSEITAGHTRHFRYSPDEMPRETLDRKAGTPIPPRLESHKACHHRMEVLDSRGTAVP